MHRRWPQGRRRGAAGVRPGLVGLLRVLGRVRITHDGVRFVLRRGLSGTRHVMGEPPVGHRSRLTFSSWCSVSAASVR